MELLQKIKEGDKKAREELYREFKIGFNVIQRFNNRGENVDDLFQIGCVASLRPSTILI
jgi:RNA polymerase sporulation-specific sigma factor